MEYGLVVLWLALYLLLTYVGATVAATLFPRFADRGVAFGLPVALTILWVVTYIVGRLSLTAGIWLGLVALISAAGLASYRGVSIDNRAYAEVAGVFTLAFCFLIVVRALDPAIVPGGGEKFLDFGLLQSLLRAESLPPEDMWFAGESVAYYYGGHLVAAILTRLTGTPGQFAYNLALSGFYATTVTAVYGLAGAVAADRGLPRRLAGGLSAFFVGIASNFATPAGVLVWLLPDAVTAPLLDATGYELTGVATGPSGFSYWDASRVITDNPADFATYEPPSAFVINEFPLFAWLNGDMHAHMMSTGFLLLAAAICFSYYQTPAVERRRRLALLVGVLPIVAGLVAVTSTWSFPSVAGLAMLAVALGPANPVGLVPNRLGERLPANGRGHELARLAVAVGVAIAVLGLGLVWSLPFWFGAASGRAVAVLPDRTGLLELIAVHGPFLIPFGLYLYARVSGAVTTQRARAVGIATVAVALLAALADVAAIGLIGPILIGTLLLARSPRLSETVDSVPTLADGGDHGPGFETVLIAAGAGLVLLVEFVFVRENVGRMNTVFKTYMQVWVLWAAAVGPVLAWLLTRWRPDGERARAWVRTGTQIFVVALVCSTAIYGALAMSNHVGTAGEPTLDGTAYLDRYHPGEAEAIRWLDDRKGQPTIVTATPAAYTWDASDGEGASAPSSLTGVPTVAGWVHEAQYRGDAVYEERVDDVAAIYTGNVTTQRSLLRQYDVEYVYVGPAEQERYGEITVDRIEGVTVAHRSGDVVIYRVHDEQLEN